MNIIPENLQPNAPIISRYLSPLFIWFSNLVYERLIGCDPDHLLCQLHYLLDFTSLETACANYHQLNGAGRPVAHTVTQLLRAMMVKYLYGCLRELEEKIRYHILIKWFVGYPVFAPGPDHTTLHRFETYLYIHHPRLFFDTVLNCQHLIQQPATASVQLWLDRLNKLFADELRLERDEDGQLLSLSLLTKRGTYRICSATDTEATIRNAWR